MTTHSDINKIPLYNSRIVDNYIKLIKRSYGHVNIMELLNYANMTSYEVADEGHWFSQDQINRFHDKLLQMTKNDNIAREAGRYSVSPDAIGKMRPFILGLVDPANVFKIVGKAAEKFTRSSTYESRKVAPNKVEVVVTPKTGIKEKKFQCENRIGSFEAIVLAFTNKLPNIEHEDCIFNGSKFCRYIISWEKSLSALWRKIRSISLAVFFVLVAGSFFIDARLGLTTILPISAAFVFLINSIVGYLEKKELHTSLEHLRNSTDQLIEQIEVNYNNARMTNEIGQAISRQTNIGDILHNIVQIFKKRLNYDRCMILLADKEKRRLLFRTGYGYTFDQLKTLRETAFHLDRVSSKGVFVVSFHKQKPFLINNINEIEGDLSLKSLSFARRLGTQSFVCCPIISDGESIGILAVDNLKSKKPLIDSDISLLMGIASVLGISIRNADLLEGKEKQFRSLIQVLAASIDARDPMTSGHSEKVTEYALGICDEMGLEKGYRDMIRVAALLHDYGKIGVPDSILKKRGKLSFDEYEIVKNHAEKTKRILDQISFEGVFSQVPEIAGAHHERYDGNGYPDGSKGEEILLGARIIAVADFFDAITSRRPYREPMSLNKALNLLHQESGKKLDKKVVKAFLKYLSKKHVFEPTYRASALELRE